MYVEDIGTSKSDKLQWLVDNGEFFAKSVVSITPQLREVVGAMPKMDEMLVCYVDNGAFSAIGIAFDLRERRRLNTDKDHRPKIWFLVKIELLKQKCPQWAGYIKD